MLNPHDDPQAEVDFRLDVLGAEIERLGETQPAALAPFRDRIADLSDALRTQAINAPRRPL